MMEFRNLPYNQEEAYVNVLHRCRLKLPKHSSSAICHRDIISCHVMHWFSAFVLIPDSSEPPLVLSESSECPLGCKTMSHLLPPPPVHVNIITKSGCGILEGGEYRRYRNTKWYKIKYKVKTDRKWQTWMFAVHYSLRKYSGWISKFLYLFVASLLHWSYSARQRNIVQDNWRLTISLLIYR
jgi:hypothetical protein